MNSMFHKKKIDPWLCMPLLGDIENLKNYSREKIANTNKINTTVNGFQPLMKNPIMFKQYSKFKDAITEKIKENIDRPFTYTRSWLVSYDKGGKQKIHNHNSYDVDFTGVVCLIGYNNTGAFCTDDKEIYLQQGDLIFFDSTIYHWTKPSLLPKSIIAFDCKYTDKQRGK